MKAVEVLMEHGVPEERIIFVNLVCRHSSVPPVLGVDGVQMAENSGISVSSSQISSPEGLKNFCSKYPSLRVVS